MEFSKRERSSSGQDGFDVEKRDVKWEEKQFPMFTSVYNPCSWGKFEEINRGSSSFDESRSMEESSV
jgi:hypothetical protein